MQECSQLIQYFKTATSFLHPLARLKNLFWLLLKLKKKKTFISVILQVESDRLICVSVNRISQFISLLSLTI